MPKEIPIPPPPSDVMAEYMAARSAALVLRKKKSKRVRIAISIAYIVAMVPFLWFAILATGGGHGSIIPLVCYGVLSLPFSLLGFLRFAFPSGSSYDVVLGIPLLLAPSMNALLLVFWTRIGKKREPNQAPEATPGKRPPAQVSPSSGAPQL
jgi:hypothetical protein